MLAMESTPILNTEVDGAENLKEDADDGVDGSTHCSESAEANEASPSPADDSGLGSGVFDLAEQQKALQRLTSTLGLGNFARSPFNFLAALQGGGNPLMQQQLLAQLASGFAAAGSPVLEGEDDENEMSGVMGVEPEDLSIGIKTDDDGSGSGHNWSYEEQFKQLYELSDDKKRKEWLDDWLSFMHRIGKPVTRIPIMAKQVLDLYELYRLVIHNGGLVEIINKKKWRDITKGLNLPSSITSAAFTLRTQYQKYLYDYECDKEGFSSHADLQQAIDGNRRVFREGRRGPGSGPPGGPLASLPFPLANPAAAASLLGRINGGPLFDNGEARSPSALPHGHPGNIMNAFRAEQMQAMFAEHQRQMERAQRAAFDSLARQPLATPALPLGSGRDSAGSSLESGIEPAHKRSRLSPSASEEGPAATATANVSASSAAIPTANLKITSQKQDGGSNDASMVVSMEINGITYQGVLFALRDNGDASSEK